MDLNQYPTQVETESIDWSRALNKIRSNSACPRNASVRVSHHYVFGHFALIVTLKRKIVES